MTEKQTEEIRGLIVALSSTNEDTFKYKGNTYVRDATTASTTDVPSLKKAPEKMSGQLISPMIEATYTQNGNELGMNTTIYKPKSSVYETISEAEKERLEKPRKNLMQNSVYGMHGQVSKFKHHTNKDPEYWSLIGKYPELKTAVTEMQTPIDNSVFKGTIGVGISVYGTTIAIYRYYISTKRFGNRAKAYSERYKELQPFLVPTQFIE